MYSRELIRTLDPFSNRAITVWDWPVLGFQQSQGIYDYHSISSPDAPLPACNEVDRRSIQKAHDENLVNDYIMLSLVDSILYYVLLTHSVLKTPEGTFEYP